jgi:uncharacterized MnhB-related membrane protein
MLTLLLIVVAVVCAFEAIRAGKLLTSALWLAGASALLSVVFYLLGARQVAVIELSVGAGLVTVLFAFAINIAGDEPIKRRQLLPGPLVLAMLLAFVFLLGWFVLPLPGPQVHAALPQGSLADVLWGQRGLDVLVQVVLIFSGVLGLLGLLAESRPPLEGSAAEEVLARRQYEMQALEIDVARREGQQK